MNIPFAIILVVLAFVIVKKVWSKDKWRIPNTDIPDDWKKILMDKIPFYKGLNTDDKKHFEYEVQEFLLNCRITGIDTKIDLTDKLLIASSAVIPIFAFPDWKYTNLQEVLLYPNSFNDSFETQGEERNILGMVGTGYMSGKMILSKRALYLGFENETDKKNTAIHEFVHLIDKSDGVMDGIPSVLLEKQYSIPWIDMINKEMDSLYSGKSDINPYGGTNRTEFFAVASEYFFERPQLFSQKHPELYKMMEEIFHQNMTSRVLKKPNTQVGTNDDCPCNSHIKFKYCCGSEHYS